MAQAKLLLVDDEEAFVESLARRLVLRDFTTVCVSSGQEALDQLQTERDIEVVILDIKMPGMDGIETIREMKRRFPLVEVIMLTGHATIESAVEGIKKGAFDYLLKPCEIDKLVSKINDAAAQKRYYERRLMEELIKPYRPKMHEAELLRKIKQEKQPEK
jgi:DNA-binding NtrC family response regulator